MNSRDSVWSGSASLGLLQTRALFAPALAGLLVIHLLTACGKVGPPIPPEDIGVAAKLERERQQRERERKAKTQEQEVTGADEKGRPPTDGTPREDVVLPPLRPIGTQ